MTLDQGLAFGLVALTIGAFIWGRFRYDVIAICALLAGVATGVVPAKSAFVGVSNDITVIIAAALVVSAAFAKSGIVEAALRPLIPRLKTERSQVPVLTAAVTILSTATKNVGALAILMPVALQLSRRTGSSPSRLLMPMAFGAMLGGIVTLVGTAPNIIVSQVREELLGKPFGMYDYAPVGLALAAIGFVFLAFAYRILPKDQHLSVTITDVKLAGDFEPWHGPDFHDVRVVKSIYPPRVKLSFTLTDANGNVIESGDRELRDLAFLNRGTSVRSNQPYRYEKRMLSDWLKREFAAEKR